MVFRDIDKEAIKQNAYRTLAKISIVGTDRVLTEDDCVVELKYEDYRYVPDNGFIGQFVERILDGKLKDLPSDVILENSEINFQLGIINGIDNKTTFYDYGNFLITDVSEKDTTGGMSFESADYGKKFNILYEPSVSLPCLALELVDNASKQAGVELAHNGLAFCYPVDKEGLKAGSYCFAVHDENDDEQTYYEFTTTEDLNYKDSLMFRTYDDKLIQKSIDENYNIQRIELKCKNTETSSFTQLPVRVCYYVDFENNDFVVIDNQFQEDATCRDVVKSVSKLAYSWARIGTDNKLYIDFTPTRRKPNGEYEVDDYNKLTTDEYYESVKKDLVYGPISKVLIGMSQLEGENIVYEQNHSTIGSFIVDGNCEQDITQQGKNLFNKDVGFENTFIDYDGSVYPGILYNSALFNGYIDVNPNDTYTLSFSEFISVGIGYYNNETFVLLEQDSWADNKIFTVPTNANKIRIFIDKDGYTTMTQSIIDSLNIQIEKGWERTPYEPFIPNSPSSQNPSDVKTVKGDSINLFNGYDVKSGDVDKYDVEFEGNRLTAIALDDFTGAVFFASYEFDCEPETYYVLSIGDFDLAGYDHCIVEVFEDGQDDSYITTTLFKNRWFTFNSESNEHLVIKIRRNGPIEKGINIYVDNIQLEKRYLPTLYVPYGKLLRFKNTGNNIFDKNKEVIKDYDFNENTGEIIGPFELSPTLYLQEYYIEVEPNTQYTMFGESYHFKMMEYDSNKVFIKGNCYDFSSFEYTITTTNETKYIRISFDTNPDKLLLTKGVDKELDTSISIGDEELCKIGDVKDIFENGIITKRIGKIILDGTENWRQYANGSNDNYKTYWVDINDGKINSKLLSPYFTNINITVSDLGKKECCYGGSNSGHLGAFFSINSSTANTIAKFKSWLKEQYDARTPVVVYYVLGEPYTVIVPYQKPQLNNGYNYITTDNELVDNFGINLRDIYQNDILYSGKYVEFTTKDYETCAINIYDNPLTYTEDLRRIAINGCERLLGIEYTPLEINTIGHPWLEGDDYIKLTNLDNDELYTYAFNRSISYKGYINGTITSEAQTVNESKYENPKEIINRLAHTEIIVDKNSNTITNLTSLIEENRMLSTETKQTVEGLATTIQDLQGADTELGDRITTVETTLDGISSTRTVVGGSNLIKNSVGYFGNDYWLIDEEHEGNITKNSDSDVTMNSISGSALLLQNEEVYQNISSIKSGDYYLSFTYKKLVNLANCQLKVNDVIIELDNNQWTEIEQPITTDLTSLNISLLSDTNNACLITDLMLCEGNIKTTWTQNGNETYTDNVKIGKGIQITSTGSDTMLEAVSEGINIRNTSNNNITSKFTKYGTETNKLTAHESATISDSLLINKVGGQIWISTID